jgi:3'-5' exoribonuclease
MPRALYLAKAAPGDILDDVFVITNKQLSATAQGKPFIKAFISDRTQQAAARMWNATREIFNALPESGFVRVRGRVENYQGNLQIILEQLWPPKPDTYDIADLVPHTAKNIEKMCQRIGELLDSIQNRHLAALLQAYRDDQSLMTSFCKAPAAMSFHHAFIGGLLEHTLNAIEIADAVCRFYPTLNRDLVIAGLFLHDLAKTWELSYECAFGYTDGGQLIGHIVKSAIWVEQKRLIAEKMLGEKIPQQLIDVLQHIILSHHGALDMAFGSAKSPATPEAMMVHFIDDMDAKLMLALHATRGDLPAGSEGNWTEYMKAFGGRLYRPDPAPADAAISEDLAEEPTPAAGNGQSPKLVLSNPLFEVNAGRKS